VRYWLLPTARLSKEQRNQLLSALPFIRHLVVLTALRWISWFQLEISFHDVRVPDVYPHLHDYTTSIARLSIAFNADAILKSRDHSSPEADPRYVCMQGS
jgi:hypothetical protein